MKHMTAEGGLEPDEIASVRRRAIVAALVNQAVADGDYLEALVVAAANAVGIRSVQTGASVDAVLELMRGIAADVVQANAPKVLQ